MMMMRQVDKSVTENTNDTSFKFRSRRPGRRPGDRARVLSAQKTRLSGNKCGTNDFILLTGRTIKMARKEIPNSSESDLVRGRAGEPDWFTEVRRGCGGRL